MALRQDDGFRGQADDVYEILVRAHRDLDEAESAALMTRLVLILANEVGDLDVIREAVALARRTVRAEVVRYSCSASGLRPPRSGSAMAGCAAAADAAPVPPRSESSGHRHRRPSRRGGSRGRYPSNRRL